MAAFSELSLKERTELKEQALEAITSGAKNQSQIARELGLTRQAVSIWVQEYKKNGNKLPPVRSKGRPRLARVNETQKAWILNTVKTRKPASFDLEVESESRWTPELLREAIRQKFDIALTPQKVIAYMRAWKVRECFIKLPPRTHGPQYLMWEAEIAEEREAENVSPDPPEPVIEKSEAEQAREAFENNMWDNLGDIDYKEELKKMKELGYEWETLEPGSQPQSPSSRSGHSVRTGKHSKQNRTPFTSKRKSKNKKKKRKK